MQKERDQLRPPVEKRDVPSMSLEELRKRLDRAEGDLSREREERRRVEEELRESREYYRNLFEHSPTAYWLQDFSEFKLYIDQMRQRGIHHFKGFFESHPEVVDELRSSVKVVRVNWAAVKLYGATCKAELFQGLERFKPEAGDRDLMKQFIAFAEGKTVYESETTNRNIHGDVIHIHIRKVVVAGHEDDLARVMVSITDITDRTRAEHALRLSEETARTLLNALTDAAVLLDEAGRILLVNRNAAAMISRGVHELLGHCVYDFLPDMFLETIRSTIERSFNGGGSACFENQWQGRTYELGVHPVSNGDGKVTRVAVFGRDITERKELEEERIRSGKLEAIGLLAGGIAHDFNNILTAVLGNLELAKLYAHDPTRLVDRLEDARKASLRARDLAQQLLTFSKGGEPIRKAMPIVPVLQDAMTFSTSGSNVKCELKVCDDPWWVSADEGQILQVFNNVIINAVQAMSEGGTICVEVENLESGDWGPGTPLSEGNHVRVVVKDEGTGIKEEHLGRIFDPYFTTKQWGSGLGLATVYSIIQKHDGHVSVQSRPGAGTVFQIYLPAVVDESPKELGPAPARDEMPMAMGRVLVMDDEEMLRQMAQEILGHLGYEVEAARDGAEALELYMRARKRGRPFDALILDLTIPGGKGGREILRQLKELEPDVRAIVCSGYHTDPVMSQFRAHGFKGIVTKPYDVEQMGRVLREVLQAPRGDSEGQGKEAGGKPRA